MEFAVNKELKKNLIKEMRKTQASKMRISTVIYKTLFLISWLVFLIPSCQLLVLGIFATAEGCTDDAWVMFMLIPIMLCAGLIVSIVPRIIKLKAEHKYLWKWAGRKEEYITLQNNSIKWSRYDIHLGNTYWEHQIQYADIQKIVHNKAEKVLYVYGWMSGKEWEDSQKMHCYETVLVDKKDDPMKTWITIPEYYDSFDKIVEELSLRACQMVEIK